MIDKKIILICGPSGSGKSTILKLVLPLFHQLEFSISATTRKKRPNEFHGKDYYFLSYTEFKNKINNNELVEYQEVYKELYYGTLKSELQRIWNMSKIPILDIDVYGAINIKKQFSQNLLSIFIHPGSIDNLAIRLQSRKSETDEDIAKRLKKATTEFLKIKEFKNIVYNDKDLDTSIKQTKSIIKSFINQ